MKQSIRIIGLLCLGLSLQNLLIAQTEPHFVTSAYHVVDNHSVTQFEVQTNLQEVKNMETSLTNCGDYIHVAHVTKENGFLLTLTIDDQTGPEYVAKLMMVLGVQHYYFNGERKEIGSLESDLQK
jgi:hypothetical protein